MQTKTLLLITLLFNAHGVFAEENPFAAAIAAKQAADSANKAKEVVQNPAEAVRAGEVLSNKMNTTAPTPATTITPPAAPAVEQVAAPISNVPAVAPAPTAADATKAVKMTKAKSKKKSRNRD